MSNESRGKNIKWEWEVMVMIDTGRKRGNGEIILNFLI